MASARKEISAEEEAQIVAAIQVAEELTSGEIRVHIDNNCSGDPLEKAAIIFEKLNMHKTALHNGVLVYVALIDKKFAIVGDKGINARVPENFWDATRDVMLEHFKNDELVEGISKGVASAGEQLAVHFPVDSDDVNELNNELSFEDEE